MSATLPIAELRALALRACGACEASEALASALVEASLSADRNGRPEIGMAHLIDYLDGLVQGRIDGKAEPVIDQPLPAVIRIDGRRGIAQLGFDRAYDRLVAAARNCGIALFVQRDTFTAGELGYYPRRLAQDGLVSLALANSHAMVASGPGRKVAFGTNPLAFGAPRPAPFSPLVFDQATSATAFVNLARAAEAGAPIPPGWAIDATGEPTTDPARAVLGALLPFGGSKGANIALMVEVLSAGLAGGAWSVDAGHFRSGGKSPRSSLTVIAIDPQAIDPDFSVRLEAQLERLAGLGVHIPGQSAVLAPAHRDEVVAIEPETLAMLEHYARRTDPRSRD